MNARDSTSSPALLMVSSVIFIRNLVSNDNIRRNQYPLWKLAISITALCRTQMIWTNLTSMPSMLSEVAVFVVSVIFVVLELNSVIVGKRKRTQCLLIRYLLFATLNTVTCMLWLGMFHFVSKSSFSGIWTEMVDEMGYLFLFKALSCVCSIWSIFSKMIFEAKTVKQICLTMRYLNKSKFNKLKNEYIQNEYIQIGYSEVFEMEYIAFYKNWNVGTDQDQDIAIWTELKMKVKESMEGDSRPRLIKYREGIPLDEHV